ncbi:MFS transporter [Corynebacteriales bacterium D3-21]|uniref:MFS transporter n=1 Tax=Speluncibacter jeojiensis TaxID=2710754 RepID=A0A9X4RFY5_9ACTN|nr:MFS transporter [Corynebacteriales bacterium D3-21]
MTQRQRIEALVGLLLGMFVAFLSSTIVSNALPTIITELHGTQDQYTWVVTATLLASTATTPIWGKFADLVSKKLLVQLALTVFTLGSILAGLSQSVPMLIGFRVLQGLGLGGLQALVVIVVAAMFSPRERGRYQGPMAAVMAVATVAGPLIGGVIVDTSWLGWRWTFYVGVPLAVIALVVIQRTLNLPVVKRNVRVDYTGATLIAGGVSTLLIWVTLAGKNFDWVSPMSFGLIALGIALLALAMFVETRAKDPIIPLRLFRDRTMTLATVASISVGVAMFGGAVFLGQYFQIARGYSPTAAGLLTLPMVIGSMLSSTISGSLITRYGRWKGYLVAGAAAMAAGFFLLSTIDHATSMVVIGAYLFLLGLGMGMTMQNLVLPVQNNVAPSDLGSASATVSFFRSMGGAAGVSVLGAVLSSHVAELTTQGLSNAGVHAAPSGGSGAGLSNLKDLPAAIAGIVRGAYGDATGRVFLISGIVALVGFVAVLFIKEVALRTQSGEEQRLSAGTGAPSGSAAVGDSVAAVSEIDALGSASLESDGAAAEVLAAGSDPDGDAPRTGGRHGSNRVSVLGHVFVEDGVATPQAAVTVAGADGTQIERTLVEPDGSYALRGLAPGRYTLIVSAHGYDPQAVSVSVDEHPVRRDFALSGGGTLTGTVITRDPGTPVTVVVTDLTGNVVARTETDAAGAFAIHGLPPGQVVVTAAAAAHQPESQVIEIVHGAENVADIVLAAVGRVEGVVTGPGGAPFAQATVTALDPSGAVVARSATDADGRYRLGGLADGHYTVVTTAYEPSALQVGVLGGQANVIDVELQPAADRPGDELVEVAAR